VVVEENNQEEEKSAIVITFSAPGSVFFNFQTVGNVYPGQFVAVGDYLIEQAHKLYKQAEEMQRRMQEQNKIEIAKPHIELYKK